jgi:DNA-binding NarL/FixJ family response regulator
MMFPGAAFKGRSADQTVCLPMKLSTSTKANRPARILIVEDEYLVALEIEDGLANAGFVVVGVAKTANEAADLCLRERPELAIMDIRLQGPLDGVDAAIELRLRFDVPSVFATAHIDAETRRRAEVARPLAWVSKPYAIGSLVELVNRVLPPTAGRS